MELTTLFTTISAASASFVAILGGLIGSKLLSISSERETVDDNIKDLTGKIDNLRAVNRKQQMDLDEEDALNFIFEHKKELIAQIPIDKCYPKNEQVSIAFDTLKPYWEKALMLIAELHDNLSDNCKNNSDDIPNTLAEKYATDNFCYSILKKAIKEIKKNSSPYFSDLDTLSNINIWRKKIEAEINSNANKIAIYEYELQQLNCRKRTLSKPKGIKLGLIIFGLFSLFCIILPLCLCPFETNDSTLFVNIKVLFIVIFSVGLFSILGYLIYLLKWNKSP